MLTLNNVRSIFDDNGYPTVDDGDYDALFLAEFSEEMENNGDVVTPFLPVMCENLDLEFDRVDDDFVAIFQSTTRFQK